MTAALIRAAGLFVPLALTFGLLAWRRPGRRVVAGALLATAWSFLTLFAVHRAAGRMGWWSFQAEGGSLEGFPVDLWLGWSLLWGAVAQLAFARARIRFVAALAFWLDLLLMPALAPVLRLAGEGRWLAGQATAVGLVLIPALLLGRWTERDRHRAARAVLQVLLVAVLTLWLLPTVVFSAAGGGWDGLLQRPAWVLGLALQLLAVPAVVAVSAVQEFARRGKGTPVPLDPPRRLVTTGPYAYLANPMQAGMAALLVGWGALLGSWWVAAAGLMAVAYGAGLATWHEHVQLRDRFGPAWLDYRRAVRAWWPRWRPHVPEGGEARLYVAATCDACSQVGAWLAARNPVGLVLVAAERAAGPALPPLRRLTYVAADGSSERGTRALGRALEHVHLGWALAAWLTRLPVAAELAQLIADAAGAGERRLDNTRPWQAPWATSQKANTVLVHDHDTSPRPT